MNTIDRINRLCMHYGLASPWSYLEPNCGAGAHSALDKLDSAADLDTTGGRWLDCHYNAGAPCNQVGARVARHEQRIGIVEETRRYHHWLGGDG